MYILIYSSQFLIQSFIYFRLQEIDEVGEAIKVLAWRWVLNRLNLLACMFYEWTWHPQDCLLQ